MATAFMKWLERNPEYYDRGIRVLTLGRLHRLWDRIAETTIQPEMRVLELGCGTGGLTCRMARAGAVITAIDVSRERLSYAKEAAEDAGVAARIHFKCLDATQVGEHFPEGTFDLIVTSLMMSELTDEGRERVLQACNALLSRPGKVVILDECIPHGLINQVKYYLLRIPLGILTWFLTRTTTQPLRDVRGFLEKHGYQLESVACLLAGSLCLFSARPTPWLARDPREIHYERLRVKVTLRSLLLDLWALFFRILPPYPKVRPGLYCLGQPAEDSPVLMTGNFDLTVRRVTKALDGRMDVWLLVVDSGGINVWCGAGGGFLTAEKVSSAMKNCGLEQVVQHREIVLPQLSAVGVDGAVLSEKTGWRIHWGPVRAEDIPDYLARGLNKTDAMRTVKFPISERLEMGSGTLGFYAILLLVPVAIFWRSILLPVGIALVSLSYAYALMLPWLPGRDGLQKSISFSLIAVMGLLVYSLVWDPTPDGELFNRLMGIMALSIFIAGEFQGMSPLMRGEQANWIPEGIIAVVLGMIYWLLPILVGWR